MKGNHRQHCTNSMFAPSLRLSAVNSLFCRHPTETVSTTLSRTFDTHCDVKMDLFFKSIVPIASNLQRLALSIWEDKAGV